MLGRLGWPLRRIQRETGVRRETASAHLKAAGIAVRPPRGWGKRAPESKPAKGPPEVSTDFGGDFPASPAAKASETPTPEDVKPAHEVSAGSGEAGVERAAIIVTEACTNLVIGTRREDRADAEAQGVVRALNVVQKSAGFGVSVSC